MKKHNFYAGPSILPEFTKQNTANALLNFAETGLSLMEVSHRSKEFVAVLDEAKNLLKEIMQIPSGYSVLFLQGGASMQFLMVPINLLETKAAYINTGVWATKAIKEAKLFGEVIEIASSKDTNFNYIPKTFEVPNDVDYLHVTTNNTIFGTEIFTDYEVNVPLIGDMSSDILSRHIDVSKYGLIYAGAQKNVGPSGATIVIVKDEILGKVSRKIPSMLNYKVHIENESMFNTPSTVAIFGCLQTLRWLKQEGGVTAMEKRNIEKANILYSEIDRNKMFRATVQNIEDRSRMNVSFVMTNEYTELENEFENFAKSNGLIGLKGHKLAGGFRASLYNAMPIESVKELVKAMQEFERKH